MRYLAGSSPQALRPRRSPRHKRTGLQSCIGRIEGARRRWTVQEPRSRMRTGVSATVGYYHKSSAENTTNPNVLCVSAREGVLMVSDTRGWRSCWMWELYLCTVRTVLYSTNSTCSTVPPRTSYSTGTVPGLMEVASGRQGYVSCVDLGSTECLFGDPARWSDRYSSWQGWGSTYG